MEDRGILQDHENRFCITPGLRITRRQDQSSFPYLLSCITYTQVLEKKPEHKFTSSEILQALRDYNLLKISGEGYIPEYTRTEITDELHEIFGFKTDTEIIPTRTMKKIISETEK